MLIAKDHERHDLEKELFKLANQGASFSSQQPAGLRDVNGAADKPRVENSVSWDFEGLDTKDENKPEYEEFMVSRAPTKSIHQRYVVNGFMSCYISRC